jgi:hypothetical protein
VSNCTAIRVSASTSATLPANPEGHSQRTAISVAPAG